MNTIPSTPFSGESPRSRTAEALLAAAPVGLALVDREFRYVEANDAHATIHGTTRGQMLGRTVAEVAPGIWAHVESLYRGVLETGVPALNAEVSAETPARPGQLRHWLCNYYPILDADGGPVIGVGIMVTDITARRQAEEAHARRAREQAALFAFTDRLHRATTLQEVFDAALDSIRDALGCDRASILLFDAAGVMRFVAWRGLSDAYRGMTEGHSPWQQGEKDAHPIGIEDVRTGDLTDSLRATIEGEGIGALAFIPLVADGRLIGKFMVYYDTPHAFSNEEFGLALTIGRQLAFGVERERAEERRRRAEQALRESEGRLQTIFNQSTAGIAQVDLTGRFLLVNQRFCEITGYTAEELSGKTCADLTHPDDRACDAEMFERGLKERTPYVVEKRYVRRDGSQVWVRNSVSAVQDADGQSPYMLAVAMDVTEHKLREAGQALLATIVSSSGDAIVSKDLNGIVTSWNASAERIYGWKAREIIGKSKALVIPPDMPDELSTILSKVKAGERIENYETRRVRKDGTIIDVAISVSPVRDAKGLIFGAASIVRDISERRRTERELERRQAEVEALNERLKRAMRETHHRVKNNLQIVSAMVDMQAIEHLGEGAVPLTELERLGTHIRTLALMHDLLTKSLREDEQEQRVSSSEAIGRLLGLLEKTTGGRLLRADVEDVELLSKQAVTLSLTINELVSNAVKHASGTVDVRFAARGREAELSVCDDGAGFPPGFDPVTHAHMGLELVLGLVDTDLKGRAYFENRAEGQGERGGACVRIVFPLPDRDEVPGDGVPLGSEAPQA